VSRAGRESGSSRGRLESALWMFHESTTRALSESYCKARAGGNVSEEITKETNLLRLVGRRDWTTRKKKADEGGWCEDGGVTSDDVGKKPHVGEGSQSKKGARET